MSYRVHIEDNFVARSYRVYLAHSTGDLGTLLLTHEGRHVPQDPAAVPPHDAYFAEIPYEAAHALLGGLARTLGAVEHPEQLRRDYEHERGRVDKLIDQLLQLAASRG